MGTKSLEELMAGADKPKQSRSSRFAAALQGFAQGASFNVADEAAAGLAATVKAPFSPKTWKEIYAEQLEIERGNLRAASEEYPGTSMAGGVVGGLALGNKLGGAGLSLTSRATTVPNAIGLGALEGAMYGGAYGAGGSTEGNRLRGAATGAAIGGVTGGVVGGATSAFARPRIPAPSTDDLLTQSRAAYKAAENAGVTLTPTASQSAFTTLKNKLVASGLDPDVHTDVFKALRSFERSASGRSINPKFGFAELDLKRQLFRDAAMGNPKERRLAQIAIREIDNFMLNLKPSDLASGDATLANAALTEARNLWGRGAKAEVIDEIMDLADVTAGQYSVSGKENAIRGGFRGLYRKLIRDKGERAMWSPEELAAIKRVATGGPIENALRLFGKASIRGPINAIPTLAGYALGGPVGAAAVAGTGEVARLGAGLTTAANARVASELVRRGGPSALNVGAIPSATNAAVGSQTNMSEEERRKLAAILTR